MIPDRVWGIKRDRTLTLFQLCSGKHSMSAKSIVLSVDQKMAIKPNLIHNLELWASRAGRIIYVKAFIVETQALEKGGDSLTIAQLRQVF